MFTTFYTFGVVSLGCKNVTANCFLIYVSGEKLFLLVISREKTW